MRAYPIAGNAHHTGKADTITFTFCSTCGTIIFGGDASYCSRCGATALEHLGLGEIATRLRAGFAAGNSRHSAREVISR